MPISDRIYGILTRLVMLLLPMVGGAIPVYGDGIAGITRQQADSLGRETVLYDGLPVTFNTLSRDLLKKIYGHETYRGLSAEQTVASLRLFPLEWKDEPLILVKDENLRKKIGGGKKYISLSSLFNSDGSYRVTPLYDGADRKETRAIEELDEKAGIMLGIISGELIVKDESVRLPEWRVDLELFYNRIPFLKILFMLLFTGAAVGGIWFIWGRFTRRDVSSCLGRVNIAFLSLAFISSPRISLTSV